MVGRFVLVAVALLASAVRAPAQPAPAPDLLYVEARRVITMKGEAIDGGRIVIKAGRIDAVGKDIPRPPFSKFLDARDLVVTPGFVLAATDLGMPTPMPGPPQEGVRVEMKLEAKAADEFVARRAEHGLLLDGGITCAGLLPVGDVPGIPGQASAITTGGASGSAVLSAEAALVIHGATHAPWRKAVGDAFEKARKAHVAKKKTKDDAERAGKGDEAGEAGGGKAGEAGGGKAGGPLAAALARKRPVLAFVDGLGGWLALRDSVPLGGVDAWILDGPDLWTDAASVKASGARILTFPVLSRERETRYPVNRAVRWREAGVPFAFVLASDDPEGAARLRDHVAELVRTGLPAEAALAALTTEPAAALGLSEKVGSIQPGRRADLLFWSAEPFDPTARLEKILVGGAEVTRRPRATASAAVKP